MSKTIPILFKPYMSRALLDNRKTETRRMSDTYGQGDICWIKELWSTFASLDKLKPSQIMENGRGAGFSYEAGGSMSISKTDGTRIYDNSERVDHKGKLRPSIFLPAFGSRQTIVMDKVWSEPLLKITDEGAIREGIVETDPGVWGVIGFPEVEEPDPRLAYFALWNAINGAGAAQKNPDVFVYQFTHFPLHFEEIR